MATIEYQTPPVRPSLWSGLRRAGILGLLAIALLYLLVAQVNPAAPMRQGFGTTTPMAQQAKGRAAFTVPLERLADGRNLVLHFVETPPTPQSGKLTTGVYYGLNYGLVPARAFVGDDSPVVNDDVTLRAADHIPTDAWMRNHGVSAVVTFLIDAGGLHRPTARLIR